jgi:hypothetical protein
MVNCPVCKRHVDYKYLRADNPRDDLGHELGRWVHCENQNEKHVYLRNQDSLSKCPYCNSSDFSDMKARDKVKCLHETDKGVVCSTRPYIWIEEGPPCFMNHIEKTRLEK